MLARPNRPAFVLTVLLALALLAAGCRPQIITTTPAVLTPTGQPAATAAPSATASEAAPPSPTATAQALPSETPTTEASATTAPEGEASATATSAPAGSGTNLAEFVADVTVPDGTDFTPDEAFVKTWQLKNVGTATWTTDYRVMYVSGESMGGPQAVPLTKAVAPGETVEVSVNLVAPTKLGTYTGFWMLSTPGGTLFGLGPTGNQPFYVQIDTIVGGTPQPTVVAGDINVSAAEFSVDQANLSGDCPQTFLFTLTFTSQGAGTVTYHLEAAADNPAFTFNLPDPTNSIFNTAGPRTFAATYNLQFTDSVSGQVWAVITAPSNIVTNKVSFSLACTVTSTPQAPASTNTPQP